MANLLQRHHLQALFVFILIALLSSCSHIRKDGPPDFYVDETKIPNAVPKKEPLAKYGNMDAYSVFGRRYKVMKNSRNYEAVGLASWYGTKFHAQRTSSGERYDMLAMTAAHKTLPLPTYAEVTNLKNHRTIIVKVNDRGPFESNRLIDLSYVAAKKLGMMGHGTALVRVKAINVDEYRYEKSPSFAVNTKPVEHTFAANRSPAKQCVFLQVAAFKNKASALHLKAKLTPLVSSPVQIANGKLYRVQIGPMDVATANKLSSHLKNLGYKTNRV